MALTATALPIMAVSAASILTSYGLHNVTTVTSKISAWFDRWNYYTYYVNQSNPPLFTAMLEWLHGHEHLLMEQKKKKSRRPRMTAFLPGSEVSFLLLPFNRRCWFDTAVGPVSITILSLAPADCSCVSNIVFRIQTKRRSWFFGRERSRNQAILDAFMTEVDGKFQPPDDTYLQIERSADPRFNYAAPIRIKNLLEEQKNPRPYPKEKLNRIYPLSYSNGCYD